MRRLAAILTAAGCALAGCGWLTRPASPRVTGLVVITLDTTRADRLSPYGFMNVSLPALERLARESVVFDAATTVAPLTLPAHTSLFTGLLPPHHGVRDNVDPPLPESFTTLAELLESRGFRTGAFVGSVVLDPDRGLRQGFGEYTSVPPVHGPFERRRQRRADAVVDDALRWLEKVDQAGNAPFFLWVHLYDAHAPYDPPEPFASQYGYNPYVGEIAYTDSQIGRLIEGLDRRRLLNRSAVVVAGDHGESLGERGEPDHGIFVYENVLRVPLFVRAPQLRPGRIGEVVRLTDVMPTVLDVLGVPSPAVDGISLLPLVRGQVRDLDLEAFAESIQPERLGWSSLRALRVGRYKVIDAPRPEFFDLERDPFEQTNIYAQRRALADRMIARAAEVTARAVPLRPRPYPARSGTGSPRSATASPTARNRRGAATGRRTPRTSSTR
jgi:arylsulfatase A-like enzyme